MRFYLAVTLSYALVPVHSPTVYWCVLLLIRVAAAEGKQEDGAVAEDAAKTDEVKGEEAKTESTPTVLFLSCVFFNLSFLNGVS